LVFPEAVALAEALVRVDVFVDVVRVVRVTVEVIGVVDDEPPPELGRH
jgi:hypothetical protein